MEVENALPIVAQQEIVPVDPISRSEHSVRVTPLGAGQEVGRSCILLSYRSTFQLFFLDLHDGSAEAKMLCSIVGSIQDMKD